MRRLILAFSLVPFFACSDDAPSDGQGVRDADNDVPDDVAADAVADPDTVDTTEPPDAGPPLVIPVSIMGRARLSASATRATALWVREDLDAVQAILDGAERTSFKAPVGEGATVCVDFQPWAERSVRITSVSVDASVGAYPVRVLAGSRCDAPDAVEVGQLNDAAAALTPDSLQAGALMLELSPSADTQVNGIEVLSDDPLAGIPGRDAGITASSRAYPGGVIEGFYGVPWTWSERSAMLRLLAVQGMQTFVYAPKNDPLHRDEWRGAYDDEFLTEFGELSALGAELQVDVLFGLSPFVDYEDATDYPILLQKLERFADFGLLGVVLLADDIEFDLGRPVDGSLGALHAEVANRLLADLRESRPQLRLFFVPTVYSDDRLTMWEGGAAYMEAMQQLDDDIEVMWTGVDTSNLTMEPGDLAPVNALLDGTTYIWDNMWANDGGDGFLGRILLSPFEGRPAELLGAVSGIAHNPSIQGGISRLSVGTFGGWFADPDSSPEQLRAVSVAASAAFALHERGDDALAEVLTDVMEAFNGHAQKPTLNGPLSVALDALLAPERDATAVLDALHELGTMATMWSSLYHSSASADLVDELMFPLDRIRLDGEAGLYRALELRERLAGRATPADELAELAGQREEASTRSRFGDISGELGRLSLGAAQTTAATSAPAAWELAPVPTNATVGEEWVAALGDGEFRVAGLAGATISGGALRWVPPHAGEWRVVVSGIQGSGSSLTWTAVQTAVIVSE